MVKCWAGWYYEPRESAATYRGAFPSWRFASPRRAQKLIAQSVLSISKELENENPI